MIQKKNASVEVCSSWLFSFSAQLVQGVLTAFVTTAAAYRRALQWHISIIKNRSTLPILVLSDISLYSDDETCFHSRGCARLPSLATLSRRPFDGCTHTIIR